MNCVEESLVSRTAIDALLEESDSKIDETIRGLKDFLVNIDGAVRKLLPLAVSLLGTDNEALLIPANILLKIGVRWSSRLHARMLQNEHDLVKKSSINIMISNEFYIVLNDGCNLK